MTGGNARPALRAWQTYAGAGPVTRAFLAARLAVVPLGELRPELEALTGRVLSLGSGHGLLERYLAEINPAVEIDGVELDEERVRLAERTAARSPRVRIRHLDVRDLGADDRYDGVLAVDVLHHVPLADHNALAGSLVRLLNPGGVALVKDIALTPRWKYEWNRFHDRVVAGESEIFCREPEEMASVFAAQGLTLELCERVGRFLPYPHYLLRLRRAHSSSSHMAVS